MHDTGQAVPKAEKTWLREEETKEGTCSSGRFVKVDPSKDGALVIQTGILVVKFKGIV